jgi:hypothetical protein
MWDFRPEHAMSVRQPFQMSRLIAAHCLGAALLIPPAAAPAHAEVITEAELVNGRTMTQPQCAAAPQAVWISAMGRTFCMRYFLSTAGGEGARPVVFLNGDAGKIIGDFNTDVRARYADRMSKEFKATMIYLGRMGLDGSSGSHRDRHTWLEVQATNAALEAIKRRYAFEGFNVYGHSGGANLVGGLLTLRRDVSCAVPADGGLARNAPKASDPALQYFDSSAHVATIAQNRSARILVVTDPQDMVVKTHHQFPFVVKLRKAGGQVEQFLVKATDDEHHFTTPHAELVMTDCLRGAGHDEIAADLAKLDTRLLAAKAMAKANAGIKRQDAPAPSVGSVLSGIDLYGADYSNFWVESAEPTPCQDACRSDAKCAAWTYVQAGVQGKQARCWLKSRVPQQSQNTCCTSGIERADGNAGKGD